MIRPTGDQVRRHHPATPGAAPATGAVPRLPPKRPYGPGAADFGQKGPATDLAELRVAP
ncbi:MULTISPECIES: hypothetical protein [Streptomyces]|uniref:Uncharacterized protein n=1 Tax=Streptomyces griseosporeus TaxID=1910 RepID=A0ABV3KWR9_STRGS|nr:hypothetical protein [Streptomyces actuosus]MBM4823908.1 hypothetical protein [Streptomyces actuosus]